MIIDKPWGRVSTYSLNQPSSVRVISVEPGHETSEHYHQLRDELWIVLDDGLRVQIGNKIVDARPGDEFVVTSEEPHRVMNVGQKRGRILEIAHGYTTEDDTFRLQDDYGRPLEPDW
jgi:mannose-6-phosphate isomerase